MESKFVKALSQVLAWAIGCGNRPEDFETEAKEDIEKFKNQIAKEAIISFAKSLDEWDGNSSESFKDGVEYAATLGYRFARNYD